jgi:hypothetical protein
MAKMSSFHRITAARPCPTSFAESLKFYADADEIVYEKLSRSDTAAVAERCRAARRLAERLHLHYQTRCAEEVAEAYGIEIKREQWPLVCGRFVYLAEAQTHPPQIRLNLAGVAKLAELADSVPPEVREWFGEKQVTGVIVAHELYHIIAEQPSRPSVELAAHTFAREFTCLPFSPLLYEAMLRETVSSQ